MLCPFCSFPQPMWIPFVKIGQEFKENNRSSVSVNATCQNCDAEFHIIIDLKKQPKEGYRRNTAAV